MPWIDDLNGRQDDRRYFDIHEDDSSTNPGFAAWVKQASQLPGDVRARPQIHAPFVTAGWR